MPEISITNLDLTYKRETTHRMKIEEFSVRNGAIVGFFGPNHIGKSTLLRAIAQLHDGLKLSTGSKILYGNKLHERSKNSPLLVHVPQDFHSSILPWFSIEKNFRILLAALQISPEKSEEKVTAFCNSFGYQTEVDLLKEYGLYDDGHKKSKKINELSGGQQQMISIIRSLIAFPDVLTMDEPFSAIDIYKGKKFRQQVLNFLENNQITTFIVSHELEDLISFAKVIYFFKREAGIGIIAGVEQIVSFKGQNRSNIDAISLIETFKKKYQIQ